MNKTIKSITVVIIGNLFTLLAGVASGFLLPKLFSVADYGYYKTYTLYSTYIGLFSLGIIDGIVLKYGSFDYADLDRNKFRAYFRCYLFLHLLFAVIVSLYGFFFGKGENRYIFMLIAIELIASNCTGYFQQISQITRRFNELSIRKILQSLATILALIPLFIYFKACKSSIPYYTYIIITLMIAYVLLFWYINTYKSIVFGQATGFHNIRSEVIELAKTGIPLMVSNLCSTLILTLDRQFVNLFFCNEEYAVYAFAYTMLSLVTVMVSAVSTVLYPTLKRASNEKLQETYGILVAIMLMVSFLAIAAFYPLTVFINWFLPQYSSSLSIFRIIFPGVALSAPITTIMHNYYKINGNNLLFFVKGIIAIVLSIIANVIAFIFFGTMESISWASIVTLFIWFVLVDSYFMGKCSNYSILKTISYILLMVVAFYCITVIENPWAAFALYIVVFCIITSAFYGKTVIQAIRNRKI